MVRYSPHWSLILVVGVLSSGCGGPKIHPVGGKVVYADTGQTATDLAGYHVELESIDGQMNGRSVSATGEIQKDGTFQITTLKENDGAMLGKHRVLIAPPHTEGDTATKPFLIDKRFMSYESSNLTVTVEAKKNDFTLTVERRKP